MLDAARIATLLEPFVAPSPAELASQLQIYLELLLRWNARMNLTAVRDPEQIVTRHFGESLFAARVLRDAGAFESAENAPPSLADVGSGAGFPGLPIKLFLPEVRLILIESQNKKATFLREVIRTLGLQDAQVFCGRAEIWSQNANVVTLRAVEKFENTLAAVAPLTTPGGTLGLLIGTTQLEVARRRLGSKWQFSHAVPVPNSVERVVLVGRSATSCR